MRMGKETRQMLQDIVLDTLEDNANVVAEYSNNGWSQQRLAWDLLWEAARCDLIDIGSLYDLGFNDGHIERAILAVVPDPQGYSERGKANPQVQAVRNLDVGDRRTLDGTKQVRVFSKDRSTVTLTVLDESGNFAGTLRRVRPQRLTVAQPVGCEGNLPDILGD